MMGSGDSCEEHKPEGYPGFKKGISEAQQNIVFLHDDRAPHGLVMACKRWYQKEMAKYLTDTSIFENCHTLSWKNVADCAQEFNIAKGFSTGAGIIYNYGIWKPVKGKFRFIAGTRSPCRDEAPGLELGKMYGTPRQPLFDAHKSLVKNIFCE